MRPKPASSPGAERKASNDLTINKCISTVWLCLVPLEHVTCHVGHACCGGHHCQRHLHSRHCRTPLNAPPTASRLLCLRCGRWAVAQAATAAANMIAYPFDTVRRRLMMQVCKHSLRQGSGWRDSCVQDSAGKWICAVSRKWGGSGHAADFGLPAPCSRAPRSSTTRAPLMHGGRSCGTRVARCVTGQHHVTKLDEHIQRRCLPERDEG